MNRFLSLNKKLVLGLLFGLIVFTSFGIPGAPVQAAPTGGPTVNFTEDTSNMNSEPVIFEPQVTIPGSEFKVDAKLKLENSTAPIAKYISAIYNYGVGIVGILAAMMLMIGGIIWLTAAGSSTKVEQAKSFIGSSLTGMALVLTAYILLKTINPDLVNLRVTTVTQLEELKCCELNDAAAMTYPAECKKNRGTIYNTDYLVSKDKKKCEKTGCCIQSETPAGMAQLIGTFTGTDKMAETKLAYSSSFPSDCDEGAAFPWKTILSGGMFGTQKITFYSAEYSCSEIKKYACIGHNPGDVCFGASRYGYCYNGICSIGTGNEGSFCGKGDETISGECFNKDTICMLQKGGLSCKEGLNCCQIIIAKTVYNSCSEGSEGSSCLDSRGEEGYCYESTCIPCKKYGEACDGTDSFCPNQDFNEKTNPGQSCGPKENGKCGDDNKCLRNVSILELLSGN